MNNLQLFNFEGQNLSIKEIDEQVYFDVEQTAIGLGLTKISKGKEYVRWERVNEYLGLSRSGQQVKRGDYITEPQFYKLAIKANNPVAERFEGWLTSEVLPAIRKHGAYMTDEKIEEVLTDPDTIIKLATQLKDERQQRQELEHKNEKLQDKINRDADDVVFARAIRYSHHAIPIRELADILTQNGFTIGQNQLYKLLRDEKYLSKQKDFWNLPMSSKVKAGYFRVIHKVTRDGRPYRKTLVTPEGQKHLINKALKGKFDDNYQKVIVSTLGI